MLFLLKEYQIDVILITSKSKCNYDETPDKSEVRGILQNKWSIILKRVKVLKFNDKPMDYFRP